MPELRRDPVTGRWVCLAPGRASRPEAVHNAVTATDADLDDCPFCEGSENRTPPEVAAIRPGGGDRDTPGWKVRVVPNLFPAFSADDADADLADPLHAHGPVSFVPSSDSTRFGVPKEPSLKLSLSRPLVCPSGWQL